MFLILIYNILLVPLLLILGCTQITEKPVTPDRLEIRSTASRSEGTLWLSCADIGERRNRYQMRSFQL
jgi:hypothetical protein